MRAAPAKAPWINIEVIDLYPTNLGHCPHYNLLAQELEAMPEEYCVCSESSQVREYPPEVLQSYERVAQLIKGLKEALKGYPVNVRIDMIEATSLKGLLKSLRHRIRRNMAVIVNGRKVCDGEINVPLVVKSVREETERLLASMRSQGRP